jgi:2-methylisocitrate lyase-like PEP mutase family enzyme
MTRIDETRRRRSQAFLALHHRPGCFVLANAWDAGSARILTSLGFEAIGTTSAGLAHAVGVGDGGAGRDATLANARDIADATSLPVSADLENGFGHSPEAAAEIIGLAIAAGLAGGSIEDFTGDEADPLYDLGHATERVRSAAQAAHAGGAGFLLTARAEGFLHGRGDLEDVIARLRAYEAAGADVVYAPGLPDLESIAQVCASVSAPVNVLASPAYTVEQLAQAGVSRVSLGSAFSRAAMGGLMAAARDVRDTGSFRFIASAPGHGEIEKIMAGQAPQS